MSVVGPALARLLTQPGLGLLVEVECEATSPASDLLVTQWDTALRLQVRCASGVCFSEYCTLTNIAYMLTSYMFVKVATTSYRYTEAKLLTVPLQLSVVSGNKQETVTIGTWDMDTKWRQDPGYDQARVKRFFSVGTVARTPWTQLGEEGQLGGYCPDMVRRMAPR